VKCWGLNLDGNLGDGSLNDSNVPMDVSGLTGVVQVAMSLEYLDCGSVGPADGADGPGAGGGACVPGDSACALLENGHVVCWGHNNFGQLGNGSFDSSSVPVDVVGLSDVTSLAVGMTFACGRMTTGAVSCWGQIPFDPAGMTRTNAPPPFTNVPIAVPNLP
jgi:hypothetical protein